MRNFWQTSKIEVPDAEMEWRAAAARPREWSSIGAMAIQGDESATVQ